MRPNNTFFVLLAAAIVASGCSKSAADFIQEGKEYLGKGDATAAAIVLKNAVQADPSSVEARVTLGEALERSGDMIGAEQHYRRALALGGNADDLAVRVALLLLDRSDYAILVKDFAERKLTLPSADSELRGIVALAYLAMKQKDKAVQQLSKAEESGSAVQLANAQLTILENRPKEAMQEIERATKEGNAPWWVLRAASRLYAAQGDQAGALAAMKAAYELAGWHQGVIGEYAEQLFDAGKSTEAKPLRNKLWKIAPGYYRTAFVEALFLMEEGKPDEAYALATKVLAALPDHIPALLIAAKVELDRGEISSADSRLRKILFINPASVGAMRLQMMVELRRKDLKAATAILERALRLSPADPGLLAASAELAWTKGEKADAVKRLQKIVQIQPPPADILIRLSEMMFALGMRNEADQAMSRALELSRENPVFRERAFRALVNMNMHDKAIDLAKAEQSLRPKDPAPIMWMAALLGSEGNEAAALEQTVRALDLRADYYPALMALAGTATIPERVKQYEDRLKRAVDVGTKDFRIYIDLARRMRIAGADPEKIGQLLERGIAATPDANVLRETAIRYWMTLGKNDKALSLLAAGDSAYADNLEMKVLSAKTHEALGNFEQAAAKYAELNARFPDRVDWGLAHSQALTRAGKASDAIQALRKLIAQRPDEPSVYQMLAMLQVQQKQAKEALLTADMLEERPKQRLAGLFLRGDVLANSEEEMKALKVYDEAAKAGGAEEALLRRVQLQDRIGREAFASNELRDWLAKHPESIPALSLASRRASAKQDYVATARYLEAVIKLEPNNPIALNDLAWAYAQGRNPAALLTAQKAVALLPDNPQVLDTLAEAQALAGQKKEAISTLRLALSLAPQSAVAKIHLAELLLDAGEKKEAASLLDKADQRALDKEATARMQRVKARL